MHLHNQVGTRRWVLILHDEVKDEPFVAASEPFTRLGHSAIVARGKALWSAARIVYRIEHEETP